MFYLRYYKLALQKAYGGDFPEMSSEEFDRRCSLEKVPIALKALYMALGTQRICRMHCLIPMPEELAAPSAVVVAHREDDRVWGIDVKDLAEENPLIQVKTGHRTKEDGMDVWEFGSDGETRLAEQMARLIAYSASSTREIRQCTKKGVLNAMRNFFALLTRKHELLLILLCMVLTFFLIQSRIFVELNERSPVLGTLSILYFLLILMIPAWSVSRWFCYWNVWLNWRDSTRFVSCDDKLLQLIRDLTLHYLRWNRPDLWFNSGAGNVAFHAEVALSNGPERFCQCRYEIISGESGTLTLPDTSPIAYSAGKQSSILMRTTLDNSGCLRFVYINAHCHWRLPERLRLTLRKPNISTECLQEDMPLKLAPPELFPVKLQNFLRKKCAEFPGIKTAWGCPAIMNGREVYLLAIIADGEVDMGLLLNEAFKLSDRELNGLNLSEAGNEDIEKFKPLYVREQPGGEE